MKTLPDASMKGREKYQVFTDGEYTSKYVFQAYLADGTKVIRDNKGKGYKFGAHLLTGTINIFFKNNPGATWTMGEREKLVPISNALEISNYAKENP